MADPAANEPEAIAAEAAYEADAAYEPEATARAGAANEAEV